jgi:hypothetical protein
VNKLRNPFGPTRTNLAPLYQSGDRPTAAENMDRLPVEPTTGHPLAPREQPGYYPGYRTLAQQAYWDEATRTVVLDRVNHVPPLRFFSEAEVRVMQAVVDRILPQDDRIPAKRIPILNTIDKRLAEDIQDGYRFEGMPKDQEAFRLGIQGIEAIAQKLYQRSFAALTVLEQDRVLETLHDGNPPAGEEYWKQMSVIHFWQLLVQDCIEGYYAHPYAWDEIGFGGPAYPRGYMRLERGDPEPWEQGEQRYAWAPPPGALSGRFAPLGVEAGGKTPTPGQEGTH